MKTRLPQMQANDRVTEGEVTWRHPPMRRAGAGPTPDPALIEALLTEWFGAPALLFSSGRAACHVFLQEAGFDRNRNTITVPRFLSRCILTALALDAFPIHEPGGDAILYYHPYGWRLREKPREPIVIEDATHAFFSGAGTGRREWRGQVGVFSLSKFFSLSGIAGVMVIPDATLAQRVRVRRDSFRDIDPAVAVWRREVIVETSLGGAHWETGYLLDSAYALLTEFPKVDPNALYGLPNDLAGIERVGSQRYAILERYAARLGARFPSALLGDGLNDLPFSLPYFSKNGRDALEKIDRALLDAGIRCRGVYLLDVSGSPYERRDRDGILLPCHSYLPDGVVDRICDVILATDR